MKRSLTDSLRCPGCHGDIALVDARERDGEIERGLLRCAGCHADYPIVDFIPRFVASDHYAASFGFQWNQFRKTQLDTYTGTTISRDRFFSETGWPPESLRGLRMLDVGCGAGRFVEVALSYGAEVFAVDYSRAVDACWRNLGPHPRLHVIQADIYALPFKRRIFDRVYCFGVLQHTPDVRRAFLALPVHLRPGGRLAVDVYATPRFRPLVSKYWLRPLTTRLSNERLFNLVRLMVPALLPISVLVGKLPRLGVKIRCAIPVANYQGIHPLSKRLLYEWSLLDTFDMLAPAYDQPQKPATLRAWMQEAGLTEVEVFRAPGLCGRAKAPSG
jgi:SAM-dependent methyltransferase